MTVASAFAALRDNKDDRLLYAVTSLALFTAAGYVLYKTVTFPSLSVYKRRPRPPEEQDIKISSILIYPIKSCLGVSVQEALVTRDGLEFDRNWMVVDIEKQKQLSARDSRGIQLIKVKTAIKEDPNALHGGTLEVSVPTDPTFPTFSVPLRPSAAETTNWEIVTGFDLWGSNMNGLVVPPFEPGAPDPSEILSVLTGHPVKLVMRHPQEPRPVEFFNVEGLHYEGGPTSSFADYAPLILASKSSLLDAQKRVKEAEKKGLINWDVKREITIDRWRPNWVVDGVETPFGEDDWQEGEVGDDKLPFLFPNRVPRCMFPNVDPLTGTRDPHVPHRVMMQYRQVSEWEEAKKKYCFGMYTIPVKLTGTVKVGDRIKITKSRQSPAARQS